LLRAHYTLSALLDAALELAHMIAVHQLTKRFGAFTAVDSISFEIDVGQVVGFIGPNGAGKTTTMRMLTGFIPCSEGRASIAGYDVFDDPMSVRRRIGYLPETPPLYPELTIGSYLRFVSQIREVPRSEQVRRVGDVMERVGLSGWENRIVGSLSKGYRQRVGLAQAIIHDPAVLILDEPTSGLDPRQVVGIRDFVRNLAEDRTVILSTHILSEVEALADRAIVIDGGQLLADDSLDGLRGRVGEGVRYRVELCAPSGVRVATEVGALAEVEQVEPSSEVDGVTCLDVRAPTDPRTAIAGLATGKGWQVRAMERHAPSLEEAFLHLVGEER
jgi:ABC-2 type transport system ATP-binding protein